MLNDEQLIEIGLLGINANPELAEELRKIDDLLDTIPNNFEDFKKWFHFSPEEEN